tara:strand:- start:263 stop:487 length:225 start_codon:yes stop_codon:yes gene_type:complete
MSSNEFNLMRIKALEGQVEKDRKRIQELETQLKLENENKRRIVTDLEVELDKMIKPPTRFKKQTNGKPTKCNKL